VTISDTTPVFRVFDEGKAKEFYVDFLGFTVEWEHRFEDGLPLYFEVSRDDVLIHLTEHHGDSCPGAAVRIQTDNLIELYEELGKKNYGYARPEIDDTPWGTKEMSVKDPFGNRLTFVASERG
jgi:catechol 2,3-dioxygenase-like lactoylglutathione lyase family enzyme